MPVLYEPISLPAEQSFRVLRWRDNVLDVELLTGPGRSVPLAGAGERWHAHPAIELTLVLSGSGTRFVGDSIETSQSPELVLIGPELPHCWRGLHGSSGYVLQFDFSPHHPFWQFPEAASLRALWERSARGLLLTGGAFERTKGLIHGMEEETHVGRLATLLRILDVLAAAPAGEQRLLSRKVFKLTAGDPQRSGIEQAIHLIVEGSHEPLSLPDIAHAVHMSRATFCRHFRRLTGRTFVDFLNDVRLDHARRLLVEGSHGICQVAYDSGFGNLSHFNRLFRRRMGRTPSAYRREQRAGAERIADK
jgi:AraC-like DNA-binding protein